MTTAVRYYAIHRRDGRILALVPIAATRQNEGVELGLRPVPTRGQMVSEVEPSADQLQLGPETLLESFRVRLRTRKGGARLEQAAKRRARVRAR
jgi:hypothetical protein